MKNILKPLVAISLATSIYGYDTNIFKSKERW